MRSAKGTDHSLPNRFPRWLDSLGRQASFIAQGNGTASTMPSYLFDRRGHATMQKRCRGQSGKKNWHCGSRARARFGPPLHPCSCGPGRPLVVHLFSTSLNKTRTAARACNSIHPRLFLGLFHTCSVPLVPRLAVASALAIPMSIPNLAEPSALTARA